MKQLLLVFIGGGAGSVARYVLGKWLNSPTEGIPYGTFLANVLGSLFIGVILGLAVKYEAMTHHHTLLLATGFCGGFTTFSTFAYESHIFLKAGDFWNFALYALASLVLAFLAVFLGMFLVRFI